MSFTFVFSSLNVIKSGAIINTSNGTTYIKKGWRPEECEDDHQNRPHQKNEEVLDFTCMQIVGEILEIHDHGLLMKKLPLRQH